MVAATNHVQMVTPILNLITVEALEMEVLVVAAAVVAAAVVATINRDHLMGKIIIKTVMAATEGTKTIISEIITKVMLIQPL